MLAAEKAWRLASEGYRTLLVCFNQRLATTMQRDLEDAKAPAGLTVTTFHRLCELMGSKAGTLPTRPSPIPREWWGEMLPDALDAAIDADPDERYHAVIIDEGQDFVLGWLESLGLLLRGQESGVFWIFHDPAQALFRPDVVGELGMERLELFEDHRNPPAVAELAQRFRSDDADVISLRQEGLPAKVIEAASGKETLETLRKTLHTLITDEKVATFRIAVLSGRSAAQERCLDAEALWQRRAVERGPQRRRLIQGPRARERARGTHPTPSSSSPSAASRASNATSSSWWICRRMASAWTSCSMSVSHERRRTLSRSRHQRWPSDFAASSSAASSSGHASSILPKYY